MAVALVIREGKASTSFVQRHLQVGYNRVARMIERMEREGVVGKPNHVGKREVLFRPKNPASGEQQLQSYPQADRLIERMESEDVGDRPNYVGTSEVGAAPKQVRGFWGRLWSK